MVYREYTDGTFSTPKHRAEEQQHLEIQGIAIVKFRFETHKNAVKHRKKILEYLNNTECSSTHTKCLNLHGIAAGNKRVWFAARSQVSVFKLSVKLGSNI